MTSKSTRKLLLSISFYFILSVTMNAQSIVLDTIRFVKNFETPYKTDKANQVTQFPFKFSGFKENDTIVDLDFYIYLRSIYTNSNSITLISPFGVKATVLTTNSCPNQYGEDINVVFNDQAYDLNIWNSFQIKSPAFFQCVPNIPAIGFYNRGKVAGGYDDYAEYKVGQMRPQGDNLNVFRSSKLKLQNDNYQFIISEMNIDSLNNTISGSEVEEFLNVFEIKENDLFTLKYDNYTNNPIDGLEPNNYYVFKCLDKQTITLNDSNTKINKVAVGSNHTFERNNTWIIEILNIDPLAKGSLVKAGLFISYYTDKKLKMGVSNDSLQIDTGIGGMKITKDDFLAINKFGHEGPRIGNRLENTNAYISNNPLLSGIPVILKFKQTQTQAKTIKIFNSNGLLLENIRHNDFNSNELTLPGFAKAGIYIIQIVEGNSSTCLKLVVQ